MTMKNQYSKIIKIERIQNERWYKQVFRFYHLEKTNIDIYF